MEESGNDTEKNNTDDSGIDEFPVQADFSNDPILEEAAPVMNEAAITKAISAASQGGGIVAARGTIDGVVIRLDGRIAKEGLFQAVDEFLATRESFLGGSEVILEWVGQKPEDALSSELSKMLLDKFKITVKSSKLKEPSRTKPPTEEEQNLFIKQREARQAASMQDSGKKTKSLFDGMEAISGQSQEPKSYGQKMESGRSVSGSTQGSGSFWDDPDARLIYSTLRSGQKIETDHSLIIFGDVNSGAEIIAGGDIIVLGTLRGVAHAGAYDETGGGRVIFALNLQPTQLRIGMVISRSATDVSQKSAEIAKVEDGMIIVEPYTVKGVGAKGLSAKGLAKKV